MDQSNGEAISTRESLRGLSRLGWDVKTICGSCLDCDSSEIDAFLKTVAVDDSFQSDSLTLFWDGDVQSILFRPSNVESKIPSRDDGIAFLENVEESVRELRPDVVATYDGYWTGIPLIERTKKYGTKVVVFVHNLSYDDASYFNKADLTVVPSRFAAEYYRRELGVDSVVAPPIVDWSKVLPDDTETEPDRVLFVNPELAKGACWFAKIANELGKRRPDIRFRVVEGRYGYSDLGSAKLDLETSDRIFKFERTSNPREFYKSAKIVLIPSLVDESFGRVAVEAMGAGIPVVATNRGALPETLGDAGFVLDIPAKYKENVVFEPTSEEVAPWIEKIIELWDDSESYSTARQKGLKRAGDFATNRLVSRQDALLRGILAPSDAFF